MFASVPIAMWPCILLFTAVSANLLTIGMRMELYRPPDEPTIFDRKNRKVYRLFRDVQDNSFTGKFQHWPMAVAEYEWDHIDAAHYAIVDVNSDSPSRFDSLIFNVRQEGSDTRLIDSFAIGKAMHLQEHQVAAVWEHIRRFMDENGPHFPDDETPAPVTGPFTLWEKTFATGPIGPKYAWAWKNHPVATAFAHFIVTLLLPVFLLWCLLNWLSYKTLRPAAWHEEVLLNIGKSWPFRSSHS